MDGNRIDEIGKFISNQRKRGFFANNVILNFSERPRTSPSVPRRVARGIDVVQLHLPQDHRSAWIIDGQHRLFGFTQASRKSRDLLLPVIAFANLSQTKQAELFLEINRNQKAIQPDLIWDLEGEINPSSAFGIISRAVKSLNAKGPFESAIRIPSAGKSGSPHLKLGNICDGVLDRDLHSEHTETMEARKRNPLFERNATARATRLSRALFEFFSLVSMALRRDWQLEREGFFSTNNGINVLLRVYERCLAFYGRKPDKKLLKKILGSVRAWYSRTGNTADGREQLRRHTSSEGGRAEIANQILERIEADFEIRGFAKSSKAVHSLKDRASTLERSLAHATAIALRKHVGDRWAELRLQPEIKKRAEDRKSRRESKRPLEEYLTLGECAQIIQREDNWRDCFGAAFGPIFRGKDGFKTRIEEFQEIRNSGVHGRGHLDSREEMLFGIYEGDLGRAISFLSKHPNLAKKSSALEANANE